jgi:tetratricopeptide (TPR) repeat protein
MGVDDRRDHSFKIPRPDISQAYNTPNACTKCHDHKSNQWASESLVKWHAQPKPLPTSKEYLLALNSGLAIDIEQHLAIIADVQLDIISRATAIQLLSYTTQTITAEILAPYLRHSEGLIRLSAANIATLFPPNDKVKYLSPLLQDQYKSVRIAAARGLITSKISAVDQPLFDKAFKALTHSNTISSWRGEGLANQGVIAIELNKLSDAEKSFIKAIKVDPYFLTGYINLADIYRAQQKPFQVASVLSKGLKNNPKSADLHYSYGLHFVRQKQLAKGIEHFDKAMALMPDNAQYAYTYILALDGVGQSEAALTKLKTLIVSYQNKAQLKELGLYLSQKLANKADFDWFMAI